MSSEYKKIIFFSRDLKIGGMEKALVSLLNRLQSDTNKITLVLENKTGELLNQLHPGIEVREYRVSKCKIAVLRKAINLLHRTFWRLKYANKYDFSCNYATYLTIGSRLADIASKNSSLYVHSDYYNYFSKDIDSIKTFFSEQGITYLKRLIFVANEAMEPIKKIFPEYSEKFLVVSNLIALNDINSKSNCKIAEAKPQKELILFVGRLEESSKRLTRLIESFKIVCDNSSEYELWIIGDGADYTLCKDLIQKYGLGNQVKLLGEKINPYPYMKMADCVILTSDFEGYPVIYNECLALRKPIITTIPVSDGFIDIRDFSVVVEKTSNSISTAIIEKQYKNIEFNIPDFEDINNKRIMQIDNIVKNKECTI